MHISASAELNRLPAREQVAIRNAIAKLEQLGPGLPYPRSSAVLEADRVRELRPRAVIARGGRFIGRLMMYVW